MSIAEAKAALRKAPGWTPGEMTPDEKTQLIATIVEICRLETPVLREVVESFMNDVKLEEPHIDELYEFSKIYILNRIAFDLPLEYPVGKGRDDNIFFGGWVGGPVHNRKARLRWPVDYGPDGTVSITGQFGGYNGDEYLGVVEFDFFAKHFPRRK